MDSKVVNNQKFVSAEVIAYELGQLYRSKKWDIGDIRTWCAEVETRYIKDIETMTDFTEIDLTINKGMVLLPCNVFRLMDVYEGMHERGHHHQNITYKSNGAYLYDIRHHGRETEYGEGHRLFIDYIGLNIDEETGELLIVKGHEIACKTWCKIQAFEEDVAYGRFDKSMLASWKAEFSGQYLAARSNYQHKDRSRIHNISIIRGNMIPKIAGLSLHHDLYK